MSGCDEENIQILQTNQEVSDFINGSNQSSILSYEKPYTPDDTDLPSSTVSGGLRRQTDNHQPFCETSTDFKHGGIILSEADRQRISSGYNSSMEGSMAEEYWDEPGLLDVEVMDLDMDKVIIETRWVRLDRMPGFGFGFAISGGVDNPHFASGEASIAVSDVLTGGTAYGKLRPNDRILEINGVNVEEELYSTAIGLLKETEDTLDLVIMRKIFLPSPHSRQRKSLKIQRPKKSFQDLGIEVESMLHVKKVDLEQLPDKDMDIEEGDVILKVNGHDMKNLKPSQIQKIMEKLKGPITIETERPPKPIPSVFNGPERELYVEATSLPSTRRSSITQKNSMSSHTYSQTFKGERRSSITALLTKCIGHHEDFETRYSAARPRANSIPANAGWIHDDELYLRRRAKSFSRNKTEKLLTEVHKKLLLRDHRESIKDLETSCDGPDLTYDTISIDSRSSKLSGIWFTAGPRETSSSHGNCGST